MKNIVSACAKKYLYDEHQKFIENNTFVVVVFKGLLAREIAKDFPIRIAFLIVIILGLNYFA